MAKQQFDVQTLKKHHFWIVAGVLFLAPPVFWLLATSSLEQMFETGKKERETARNSVEKIAAATLPNQKINAELARRSEELNKQVKELWQSQQELQHPFMYFDLPGIEIEYKGTDGDPPRKEPVFVPGFLQLVEGQLKQIGIDPKADIGAVLNARKTGKDVRGEILRYYVTWLQGTGGKTQFERLYDIIGLRTTIVVARKTPEKKKDDGPAPLLGERQKDRPSTEWSGNVAWSESERRYLQDKFGKGAAWRTTPSTKQVIYTQESLNIYAVLLFHLIKNTNDRITEDNGEGTIDHHMLPIKMIVTLRIGEDCQLPAKTGGGGGAGKSPGGGSMPGGAGGMPGGAGGMPGGGGGPGGGQQQDPDAPFGVGALAGGGGGGGPPGGGGGGGAPPGGGGGSGGSGAGGPTPPDGQMRFVDDDGFAIADPTQQTRAEFRMLPVTLRVVMDHRYLPVLLDNCLNSPLPIEVRQWNMRTVSGAAHARGGRGGGAGGGGMPGGAGAMPGGGGGEGGGGGDFGGGVAGGGGGPQGAAAGGQFGGQVEIGPYDREVEIKGVIYIFESEGAAVAAAEAAPKGNAAKADVAPKADPAKGVAENGAKDNGAKTAKPSAGAAPAKGPDPKEAASKGPAPKEPMPKAPASAPPAKTPAGAAPGKN